MVPQLLLSSVQWKAARLWSSEFNLQDGFWVLHHERGNGINVVSKNPSLIHWNFKWKVKMAAGCWGVIAFRYTRVKVDPVCVCIKRFCIFLSQGLDLFTSWLQWLVFFFTHNIRAVGSPDRGQVSGGIWRGSICFRQTADDPAGHTLLFLYPFPVC